MNKFKMAIKERELDKKMISKAGCHIPLGTGNVNASKRTTLKRRASRNSLPTFNTVDFHYTGNSNEIQHLI